MAGQMETVGDRDSVTDAVSGVSNSPSRAVHTEESTSTSPTPLSPHNATQAVSWDDTPSNWQ